MRHILFFSFFAALLSADAFAVDRFVDANDPQCSDLTGTPYCLLGAAIADAQDGDRVRAGAGTYFESLHISRDITVRGAGAGVTIVDGGASPTFELDGTVTLERMTITGADNRGVASSGSTRLVDCEVSGNHGDGGGGILQASGSLELLRTVVRNNSSNAPNVAGGAGIWTQFGSLTVTDSQILENHNLHPASPGGGLKIDTGSAILTRTTIAGNTSQNNGAGLQASFPVTLVDCAVYDNTASGMVGGVGSFSSNLTLINTTVSGNRAWRAAGVFFDSSGALTLRNSTIYANESTASIVTGGVFASSNATTAISNTIAAGNFNADGPSDCRGFLRSEGYNLIQASDCLITGDTSSNLLNLDAELLPLADNGGSTWTHALGDASPARDAGNPAAVGSSDTACPELDQRGVSRPREGSGTGVARCDIGALESTSFLFADGFESGDSNRWSL